MFTLSNYRALNANERVGPPSLRPLLLLLQHQVLRQALFFPLLQWLNADQEAVRDTEADLAKERRVCPGELSMSITSDYLQFYSEDFEGKASNSTLRAMFIQGKTSVSVFNSETIPRGLCPYQKWTNRVRNLSSQYIMYDFCWLHKLSMNSKCSRSSL